MNSLRFKLSLWYVIFTVGGLLGMMVISYVVFASSLRSEIDRTLAERANHVVDALSIQPNRPITGISIGTTDEFDAPGVFLQVLNSKGEVVAQSFNLGSRRLPAPSLTEIEIIASAYYQTIQIDQRSVRIYYELVTREGVVVGAVQVGQSLIGLESSLSQLRFIYGMGIAIVVGFGLFSGWVVTHLGLKPITRLTATAQEIVSAKDLTYRVFVPKTNDELQILAMAFNQMLDRLQSVFEGQSQFLAEVAHELRTPLSSMLGNVDLIVRYGEDTERRVETTKALQRTGRLVARLIDDLLLLAQSEAGWHLRLHPISLDDIMIEVYESLAYANLQLQTCESASVLGDADRLNQVLVNLIENAIKYSYPESIVSLNLWRQEHQVWIQVQNSGSAIPQEALSQIFSPFFRISNDSHKLGVGLGLYISRWIINEHGGSIIVESSDERGTIIKFWLPEYILTTE